MSLASEVLPCFLELKRYREAREGTAWASDFDQVEALLRKAIVDEISQAMRHFIETHFFRKANETYGRKNFFDKFAGYCQHKLGYAPGEREIVEACNDNNIVYASPGQISGVMEIPQGVKETLRKQRKLLKARIEEAAKKMVEDGTRVLYQTAELQMQDCECGKVETCLRCSRLQIQQIHLRNMLRDIRANTEGLA